jgi:glycosyltransferase involved in cell wall biosynthesis
VDRHGCDPATTPVAPWGPDLDFPGYTATGDELVVSAGQTGRDPETLLRALDRVGAPARVYVDRREHGNGDLSTPGSAAIEVVGTREGGGPPLHYGAVLEDLRRASVVAIPLPRSDRLLGLTELNDALALAKPVVMTRTDAIDVDVEAIGCGFTVEAGDVDGWARALVRLTEDAELRAAMGARGREFAERHHNAETFDRHIVAAIRLAAGA